MQAIREVYPYLIVRGAAAAIEFYRTVFGAEEIFRLPQPEDGRIGHAELKLGPITIMLADEFPELGIRSPLAFGGTGTTLHLHVDDVDTLAERALHAGATMVREPADYDHGERQCRVRDPFGHEWLLGHEIEKSSQKGTPPRREVKSTVGAGRPNLFPCLRFRDEHAAMDWLERAFGFERHAVYADDDGIILHVELKLGPGILMLGSAPEDQLGYSIYVYVEDLDAHYACAREAGAEITRPLADTSYGTREYGARDLDGHLWFFGTYHPGPGA
jgi:PhnB protein